MREHSMVALFLVACAPVPPHIQIAPAPLPAATVASPPAPSAAPAVCAQPIELRLVLDDDFRALHLRAKNCSARTVHVVYDARQRADLLITTATQRAVGRHHTNTQGTDAPVEIAPNEEIELDSGVAFVAEGRENVYFGDRRYLLGRGDWRIRARFTSTLSIDGSWVGELTSNDVEMHLR